MITLSQAIYASIFIACNFLTWYAFYRGGFKAGRDNTLELWSSTEENALKSSQVFKSQPLHYDDWKNAR